MRVIALENFYAEKVLAEPRVTVWIGEFSCLKAKMSN